MKVDWLSSAVFRPITTFVDNNDANTAGHSLSTHIHNLEIKMDCKPKIKCEVCGKSFSSYKDYIDHVKGFK